MAARRPGAVARWNEAGRQPVSNDAV